MRRLVLVFLIGTAGCGGANGECVSACDRVWQEAACDFQIPGYPSSEAQTDCESECRTAFRQQGELDGYDPFNRESVPQGVRFELQNRAQAEAWVDCVEVTSCEDILDGVCPGGGVN